MLIVLGLVALVLGGMLGGYLASVIHGVNGWEIFKKHYLLPLKIKILKVLGLEVK